MFTAILALALLLTLAGCQCDHQWAEADCGNPKTCAKCGETEGEPLGHDWAEATCQAPKTCIRCDLTEGDALGHSWREANYQDPETCATCGATQGEPLEADFEKHGLEINLWVNKHYYEESEISKTGFSAAALGDGFPYVTACSNDESKKTTGALYLCNYRIFQSDETHRAVDGYEWRALDVEIEFSDENFQKYGMTWNGGFIDYYDMEKSEAVVDMDDYDKETSGATGTPWEYLLETADDVNVGEISFHGETYSIASSIENNGYRTSWPDRTRCVTFSASFYACVPIGYDGVVFYLVDSGIQTVGLYPYEYADENTLFFRLDDQALNLDWL